MTRCNLAYNHLCIFYSIEMKKRKKKKLVLSVCTFFCLLCIMHLATVLPLWELATPQLYLHVRQSNFIYSRVILYFQWMWPFVFDIYTHSKCTGELCVPISTLCTQTNSPFSAFYFPESTASLCHPSHVALWSLQTRSVHAQQKKCFTFSSFLPIHFEWLFTYLSLSPVNNKKKS